MKKREWVNPNRMKIDTMHKKFNQQTNFIGPGQVVSDTQFSLIVRAWNDTEGYGGTIFEPGHLQNFDLEHFFLPHHVNEAVKRYAKHQAVTVYEFMHYNGDKRITHGYVITDSRDRLLNFFITGPTMKSGSVIHECIQYVSH